MISQQLHFAFMYSTELFKPATIERMAKDLRSLLESAAVAPQSRIWDLPMSAQQSEAPTDTVAGILAELGASGVRLSVDDGRLKVNAPKGALNDELKAAIASHRDEIIARLRADRAHGIPRPEASSCRADAAASPDSRAKAVLVPGQDRPGPQRSERHSSVTI